MNVLWSEIDTESMLYYLRTRHLDALSGRFIQSNPLSNLDPMGHYVYAPNNPLTPVFAMQEGRKADRTVVATTITPEQLRREVESFNSTFKYSLHFNVAGRIVDLLFKDKKYCRCTVESTTCDEKEVLGKGWDVCVDCENPCPDKLVLDVKYLQEAINPKTGKKELLELTCTATVTCKDKDCHKRCNGRYLATRK